MKTSIYTSVSALALMIAAPAVAQNNTSDVDQLGAAASATVNQTGSNNDSDVDQNGNGAGAFGSGPNAGLKLVASVTQAGDNSESKVDQTGDRNSATVNQTARAENVE